MKKTVPVLLLFVTLQVQAQRVDMPLAKFKTGDDPSYSLPSTDDNQWSSILTDKTWELQGYEKYDGYTWYRFHFLLPSSLKESSYWKDSLRINLAKVDDVCEVFFNGMKIGKSGSFPEDPGGYRTTWNRRQEFRVPLSNPLIHWDAGNIIAVRVYDGGGPGGMYGSIPFITMLDLIDGVEINNGSPIQFISKGNGVKTITLLNTFSLPITGTLNYAVNDTENGKSEKQSRTITLPPNGKFSLAIPVTMKGRTTLAYGFEEVHTRKTIQLNETLPYILTPAPNASPRINGARIFGVRPNSPFLFKIPATGKKPLQYAVEHLPAGLKLDKTTGIITGSIASRGDYNMTFIVKNEAGMDKRSFTVRCGDLLALTPPMGWNSWNCWGLSVSDERVKISAQAMIDKGLIDHGWTYMNIDDGWEAEQRNAGGEIVPNHKFPDMKKMGDWLHSRGLKFGIYSSPGTKTCGNYLGSYQHERQDASSYANWGIDYLKYDWCSYEEVYRQEKDTSLAAFKKPYALMQQALQQQNRDIVYSLCQYGMRDVWKWGAEVNGNCWRTTGDIEDTWESLSSIGFSQVTQYIYANPGRWNDPDMMIVGQVGWGDQLRPTRLSPDEQYTHVSLWCLLSAPLLIGCDLGKLDDFTLNLLTNDEVLAVDQDPLGKQARPMIRNEKYQVWVKEMEDGSKAIGIFNMTGEDEVIRFYWNELQLPDNQKVRDLWRQKDLGNFSTMFASKVPSHGVSLIRIQHTP
ncbi:MAG: putative Ig domain-containing protein [Ferruginibacter sp.]